MFVDEIKSMLSKSNWDHQKTDISIHGPMTPDVHSNFKMKDGQVFLKSRKNVLKNTKQDENRIMVCFNFNTF